MVLLVFAAATPASTLVTEIFITAEAPVAVVTVVVAAAVSDTAVAAVVVVNVVAIVARKMKEVTSCTK